MRPWLFMRAAGIEFTERRVALFTSQWREEIAGLSPTQLVPVLRDGSLVVCDSLAICEYLNERYPDAGGWPSAKDARAVARSVSAEMHSGFVALRSQLPMNCRAHHLNFAWSDELRRDVERIRTIWRDCRQRFGDDGPWLFGKFSIADAMYAPVVMRFLSYDVTVDGIESDYADALRGHRAVNEWVSAAKAEPETISQHEVETDTDAQ